MAKQYTQAEWDALQAKLPMEDRVPYVFSPDLPEEENVRVPVTDTVAQITSKSAGARRAEETITARKERFASELEERAATKPTEDPGPGFAWVYNVSEGRWKKISTGSSASGADKSWGGQGSKESPLTLDGKPFTGTRNTWQYVDGILQSTGNSSTGSDVTKLLEAQAAANKLAAQQAAAEKAAVEKEKRQSAYDLLYQQFAQYGLEGLVTPLKSLIESGVSPSEFTLRLRETDAYKKRFAANATRINKGLRALSEAEYIGLEDQYQDVMRRYGLPDTYYTRGEMGRQEGFEKFIGGDVSPVELEDRIQTAQKRVINSNPEVVASLRSFYPEIGQGDLLSYFLDPEKAIENIRRKVTAAEIGGAATMAGLATGMQRAEELGRYGVTKEQAQQGYQTIADVLPRGSQLAEIYKQGPYTQTTAEQEVFGLAGATEAAKQRRKLTQLETAAFSGSSGAAGGALARDRAGAF